MNGYQALQAAAGEINTEYSVSSIPEWDRNFYGAVADMLFRAADRWEYEYESYFHKHLTYIQQNGIVTEKVMTHLANISEEYANGQFEDAINIARRYLDEHS